MNPPSATKLARTVKSGDGIDARFDRRVENVASAFDLFYVHLLNYAVGLTGNLATAEDLVQTLFRHVLLHFPEEKIGQVGLLRRKLYQLFVDSYRSAVRRRETVTDRLPETEGPKVVSEPFSKEEESAFKDRFWSELPGTGLTDLQKEAVWLIFRLGHSYKEAGKILGVPTSTISDWVALARKRIRKVMES